MAIKQFSENKAILSLILIGLFYLISGFGEFLRSTIEEGGIKGGGLAFDQYFLAHIYWEYLFYLSLITILTGLLLLFRFNFARIIAIALAWWNIFTGPIIDVWNSIYFIKIKKLSVTDSWLLLWIQTIIIISILIAIRLFIIYLLKRSKKGC